MSDVEQGYDHELSIPHDTVVQIVELLGTVAGMEGSLLERKKVLMTHLSRVLQADGWLWSVTQVIQEEKRPVSMGVIYGGLTEEEFSGWVEASQIASPPPPEDSPLTVLLSKGHHFTRTRQQVVPDEVWYNHPTVKQFRLVRGIDHFLYSIYPAGPNRCSAVGFFRRVGKAPFTDLQRRLCHIVLANVKWLHENSFPNNQRDVGRLLTPRQRTVLVYLLHGKQKEEIAKLLCISTNTVKSHIRDIYQAFSVKSQIELIRHFYVGNGGDIDPA